MKKDMDPKKKLYLVMVLSALSLVVMLLIGSFQQQKANKKRTAVSVTVKAAEVEPAKETTKEKAEEKAKEATEDEAELSENVLESVQDLAAGKKLSEEQLDMQHSGKYFTGQKIKKNDVVYRRIQGKSYVKNDHVKLSDLRYLKMLHYNFKGEIRVGEMIVNKSVEKDVRGIFLSLFRKKYPIRKMYLVEKYWAGDSTSTDAASIKADNTSCFNYRAIIGSTKVSKHAMGLAIDLNPFENPYIPKHNGTWDYSALGKKEKAYAKDRSPRAYVITTKDAAYKLFKKKGFAWGGSWHSVKDYQHFEK